MSFPNHLKEIPIIPKLQEFVVSFVMVQCKDAQHFTVGSVYFPLSGKIREEYFALQTNCIQLCLTTYNVEFVTLSR